MFLGSAYIQYIINKTDITVGTGNLCFKIKKSLKSLGGNYAYKDKNYSVHFFQ